MTRLAILAFLLFASSPVGAQVPDSAFHSAWRSGGLVQLWPPGSIRWRERALAAMPAWDPLRPDTGLLRRNYDQLFGGALISFDSPLDGANPSGHYYVLADSGVFEVAPVTLRGTIEVATEPPAWPVHDITYSGVLLARPLDPASPVGRPGFGLFSRASMDVTSVLAQVSGTPDHPLVIAARGSDEVVIGFDSTHASLPNPGWRGPLQSTPTSARLFHVRDTDQWYLLVRWDGEMCYGAFMLYDLTTSLPRYVAQNPSACDE